MKLNKYILLVITAITSVIYTSCSKSNDAEPTVSGTGKVQLEFENLVGEEPLVLNTETYKNAHGDSYNITTFKYYVSNISLVKEDGSSYKVPESYLLMDASEPQSRFQTLEGIPAGDYKAINFTIGVDSARNFAGAQTNALDPAHGMFWAWSSGYIFVKFEGTSPQSTAKGNTLTFHIGGAKSPTNTIRTATQTFGGNLLRVRDNSKPEVHFAVNAATMFTGKANVDFAALNFTMGGVNSVIVADNYASSFITVEHIHN
ncbi:hypothetical protein GCM10023149_01290 [Mucilaginibacter gynuensis]|uniref:Copper-binding protein MbnP-like domain-containing protein n=1 Tax=Mucilaginibacter gynuensis TaxID=1302236 RepID=A0ABP8FNA8_9SPHI